MVFKFKKLIPLIVMLAIAAGVVYMWRRQPAPPEPIVYPESVMRELVKNFTSGLMVASGGKRMVTTTRDSIRVWDCETGTLVYTVPQNEEFVAIGRMALSNSGATLAVPVVSAAAIRGRGDRGSGTRPAPAAGTGLGPLVQRLLTPLSQTQPSQTQPGQPQRSQTQPFRGPSVQNAYAPPASMRSGVQLVGLQAGRSPEFLETPAGLSPPSSVEFSRSDRFIAGGVRSWNRDGGVRGGTLIIWERGQPKAKLVLPDIQGSVVAFAPDDDSLASVSGKSSAAISILDRATGKTLRTIGDTTPPKNNGTMIRRLVYSPDGALLASAFVERSGDKESWSVKVWDVRSGDLKWSGLAEPKGPGGEDSGWAAGIRSLFFSPNGRTLVATLASETLVWDASSGRLKQRFFRVGGPGAFLNDDGTVVVAIGEDKAVKFVDAETGRVRASLMAWTPKNHEPGNDSMLWVTYTADGHYIATPGADGALRWYTLTDVNAIPTDIKGVRDPAGVREALGQTSP